MPKTSCNKHFKQILIVIVIFGIIVPLFMQIILLLTQQSNLKPDAMLRSHHILYVDLDLQKSKVDGLSEQLTELETIRIKALNDLLKLDKKRIDLIQEMKQLENTRKEQEKSIAYNSKHVEKYKKEIEYLEKVRQQKVVTNVVYVGIPKSNENEIQPKVVGKFPDNIESRINNPPCTYSKCFDYSKCSILSELAMDVENPNEKNNIPIYNSFKKILKKKAKLKNCASVYIIDSKTFSDDPGSIDKFINNNKNNMIYIYNNYEHNYCTLVHKLSSTNNILIMSKLCPTFRNGFDFIIPEVKRIDKSSVSIWKELPMLLPIKRKYFLYFNSEYIENKEQNTDQITDQNIKSTINPEYIAELNNDIDIYIRTKCKQINSRKQSHSQWKYCDEQETRSSNLRNSTFTFIIIDYSNPDFLTDIVHCFSTGTVPILIGQLNTLLPYKEIIDWKLATILIPYQRLPEIIFTLRTITLEHIFSLKSQGRFLYEKYFSTHDQIIRTTLTIFRNFLNLPPELSEDFISTSLIKYTNPQNEYKRFSSIAKSDLNFTYLGLHTYRTWNTFPGALNMYPVVPWTSPTPTRFQFLKEAKDLYMPIGDGKGGDGAAFSRSLGGDYPLEQFTIIMLTYDRNLILIEALLRLSGMKYLHKVIVVWNNPLDPPKDLQWPDIGVKIEVIRAQGNSLNNRFIPYDNIETEAILSMDDDIYLRHDEIELAFRVWRENRDRLVGFPGRHHAYNVTSESFYYNSEHSCELSLVLTGGAFFHKFYSYVYTYELNHAVKQMVDDYMNCEDIAMNFLVSHITQKPPVKVTSRWTFRCPGCPVALSADENHYEERNSCIGFFEKVFGYNPLKRTQYRADSILFKTRLPSTMTKCFQYV